MSSFISTITSGNCGICLSDLGHEGMIHEDGGEEHPIHRKCLEIGLNRLGQTQSTSNCPICSKKIEFIEDKGDALIRMARQGNTAAITAFMHNGPFPIAYGLAVSAAAKEGHHKIVEALLKNGNISNADCGFALKEATRQGHIKVVQALLLKRNMCWERVPSNDLEQALKIAVEENHKEIIEELTPLFQITQFFEHHFTAKRNLNGHVDSLTLTAASAAAPPAIVAPSASMVYGDEIAEVLMSTDRRNCRRLENIY